ncbi:MAG: deoxyribonuclease IV [Synergistaceae bacterium]|jgi:deoxyribonuclease-4|nr:deoxyribonuclease IV [Synergistaceae bacterium]
MSLLGSHISSAGGLRRAIGRAEALGCEAMQIFTRNPLQWRGKNLTDAELDAFRRALLGSSITRVISHASYLINMAAEDSVRRMSVDAAICEIERCHQLGIDSVVIHPGSSKGGSRRDALSRLVESLDEILDRTRDTTVSVLLETMAGQGGTLGSSVDEIASVLDRQGWDRRLGICADLCHLFGAGLDIRTEGGYSRLVSSLAKHVGLERIGCWHMSDNKGTLGSSADRHAHIGEGEIGAVPFGMLVSDERFADIPAILETPKDGIGDEGNLALLRKLRGRP